MWRREKLKDICKVFADGNWIETKDQSEDGIRLVQTGNIKTGSFSNRIDKARFINEDTFKRLNCTEIFEGDLLVSRLPDPVGRACLIPELKGRAITSVDCTIIRLKELILPEFACYFMQSPAYFSEVKKRVTGATRQRISRKNLGEILFPIPPLAAQQRIVAKLDTAFAEIDDTIYNSVKNKINITKIFDNAQIAYFSSLDTYENCSLFDVCEATQGVQISKANQIDELRLGYRRYLYISDFQHSKNLKYVKDDFPKKIVTVDDIIVVNTGATAGKIFRGIDGILSNNLFKVSPDVSKIKPDFLFKFVNSPIFKNYQKEIMRGAANPHMGHQNFLSTPIKLPSLSIQAELLDRLQTLEMQTENYLSALTSKIEQLEQLKSAILAQELQSEAA